MPGVVKALGGQCVAAVAGDDESRHAADGREADAGEPVDLPVGQSAAQQFDDGPAVGQRLQFRGRAQIAEERAAFVGCVQREDRLVQRPYVLGFLAPAQGAMQLPARSCVLIR